MKIDELEHFSVDELQNLSIEQLEMKIKKLAKSVKNDNEKLPLSVYQKLYDLSGVMPIEVEKPRKDMTIKDALGLLSSVLLILKSFPEAQEKCIPYAEQIIEAIAQFISHVLK